MLVSSFFAQGQAVETGFSISEASEEYKALTYNIHRGTTRYGIPSLEQISEILKKEAPDFIALQEVDRFKLRSGFVDQIKMLGEQLEMEYAFGLNMQQVVSEYGNGLLSKYPILEWGQIPLAFETEQRSMLWAKVQTSDGIIYITSIHLGLDNKNRPAHFNKILEFIEEIEEPILLLGDFNVLPDNQDFMHFRTNVTGQLTSQEVVPTYIKNSPVQIDYIIGKRIHEIQFYNIPSSASDHYPLILKFKIKKHNQNFTII